MARPCSCLFSPGNAIGDRMCWGRAHSNAYVPADTHAHSYTNPGAFSHGYDACHSYAFAGAVADLHTYGISNSDRE